MGAKTKPGNPQMKPATMTGHKIASKNVNTKMGGNANDMTGNKQGNTLPGGIRTTGNISPNPSSKKVGERHSITPRGNMG